MRTFATRSEAEAAMREYERRGHEQAYLVRTSQNLSSKASPS